jgi:ADP-ribose pyrophosphatase YjhB (NUDIX family)
MSELTAGRATPDPGRAAGPARRLVHAFSAGGIVLRGQPGSREILLVGRARQARGGQLWALPKGTPIAEETPQHTALREVREETGLEVAITGYAGTITYSFVERGTRYRKRVAYYTMVAIGGDTALHDHEYDFARWFVLDDALDLMRYPNETDLVRRTTNPDQPAESQSSVNTQALP